ncbi:hypothetical protein HK101_003127 [Irineochytrium annulatum]|nr:hypothetical protein HK101_003127 [Irineochytrium annulatum]
MILYYNLQVLHTENLTITTVLPVSAFTSKPFFQHLIYILSSPPALQLDTYAAAANTTTKPCSSIFPASQPAPKGDCYANTAVFNLFTAAEPNECGFNMANCIYTVAVCDAQEATACPAAGGDKPVDAIGQFGFYIHSGSFSTNLDPVQGVWGAKGVPVIPTETTLPVTGIATTTTIAGGQVTTSTPSGNGGTGGTGGASGSNSIAITSRSAGHARGNGMWNTMGLAAIALAVMSLAL